MATAELPVKIRDLVAAFDAGDAGALARAITWVETGRPGFEDLLRAVHPRVGRAHRIGVTGPPGAGKSTLILQLVRCLRERGERVGIVAVDPTSPFTGGALLGDRIRMNEVSTDSGVFIRSMASRGSLGGLAMATREAADLLDAFGFERVIVETVGVGQTELEVARAADTTVVVLVPESGDSIQAMKAGLMEIADLYAVNKADRPDADRLAREIEVVLHLRAGAALRGIPAHHGVDLSAIGKRGKAGSPSGGAGGSVGGSVGSSAGPEGRAGRSGVEPSAAWRPPVLKTVARSGEGVTGLLDALDRHRAWLVETGLLEARRRERLAQHVRAVVQRRLHERVWNRLGGDAILAERLAVLSRGETTPYEVADLILARLR